jgi:hypothetical protein
VGHLPSKTKGTGAYTIRSLSEPVLCRCLVQLKSFKPAGLNKSSRQLARRTTTFVGTRVGHSAPYNIVAPTVLLVRSVVDIVGNLREVDGVPRPHFATPVVPLFLTTAWTMSTYGSTIRVVVEQETGGHTQLCVGELGNGGD